MLSHSNTESNCVEELKYELDAYFEDKIDKIMSCKIISPQELRGKRYKCQ